nr:cyanophycin synthetase [Candidatus Microthrix sp.]
MRLAIAGEHHVTNALRRRRSPLDAGIAVEALAEALGTSTINPWRMEVVTTPAGGPLINDAYNANPTSMSAALTALAALPARRKVAVLGEMAELGADAEALHHEMVAQARRLDIEVVAVSTGAYGVDGVQPADAAAALTSLGEGEAALVKGSRVAGLEQIVSQYWPGKGPTLGKLVAIRVAHLGERKGHHRPKQQHRGAADPVDHRAGEQAADRHQPGPGDHPQAHHPAL